MVTNRLFCEIFVEIFHHSKVMFTYTPSTSGGGIELENIDPQKLILGLLKHQRNRLEKPLLTSIFVQVTSREEMLSTLGDFVHIRITSG